MGRKSPKTKNTGQWPSSDSENTPEVSDNRRRTRSLAKSQEEQPGEEQQLTEAMETIETGETDASGFNPSPFSEFPPTERSRSLMKRKREGNAIISMEAVKEIMANLGKINKEASKHSLVNTISQSEKIIARLRKLSYTDCPLGSPTVKKRITDTPMEPSVKPTMVDQDTDMTLTPSWWETIDSRNKADHLEALKNRRETAPTSAMETKSVRATEKTWSEVIGRKSKLSNQTNQNLDPRKKNDKEQRIPTAFPALPAKKTPRKPVTLQVKVGEGQNSTDTIRKIRSTDIDFEALGTKVTGVRTTRNGDVLVELTRSKQSSVAAVNIQKKLFEINPGTNVVCLRQTAEVEVIDLDELTTKEEVAAALLKAIGSDANEDMVKVTGLWPVRGGQQVATAQIPTSFVGNVTNVRIGWTQCRVRPRCPEPLRCYRCHGYGHGSRDCKGPDLTASCRRCGSTEHKEKTCNAGGQMRGVRALRLRKDSTQTRLREVQS